MDAVEITQICRRITPHAFAGVYAANEFSHLRPGQYAIINTLPSYAAETMGHWIYLERRLADEEYVLFDALAGEMALPIPIHTRNTQKVQCANAVTCAPHCIYFAYLRYCLRLSFTDCLRQFSPNCRYNDKMVREFINTI